MTTEALTVYYVPNVGPSIYMTEAAVKWAERIGSKVEKAEFRDFEKAKVFATRILSTVTDKKGTVLFDPRASDPASVPEPEPE